MAKNLILLFFVLVGGVFIYAYYSSNNPSNVLLQEPIASSTDEMVSSEETKDSDAAIKESQTQEKAEVVSSDWRNVPLENINDAKTFRISDFSGAHIVLESFAVWCPTCLKQQNEVKKARVTEVDQVVHIGLNTDPNEDEAKVKEYIGEHGFDWLYAIAPQDMTQQLIDEFGFSVVNAPQAPMIHICPDGSAELLKRGLKTAEELNERIETACE